MKGAGNLAVNLANIPLISKLSGVNAAGLQMVLGQSAVTGSLTDIDTGLKEIKAVVVTVKDADQGAGDGAYVTYNHGADGLLDLYSWDDAGSAASVAATVTWLAIGIPKAGKDS